MFLLNGFSCLHVTDVAPVDFSGIAEVCINDKKTLKDCHKLCIIYIIFSPDPDKEIWDSSEGDWGLR